jgi:hypothetical protein
MSRCSMCGMRLNGRSKRFCTLCFHPRSDGEARSAYNARYQRALRSLSSKIAGADECHHCGVSLGITHPNRKYCSTRCLKAAYRLRHPDKPHNPPRGERILRKYGITEQQFNEMFVAQGERCAICGTSDPRDRWGRFHIDHCHETGRVRGLLCGPCNIALGHMNDDPVRLSAAARYILESWPVVHVGSQ